MTRFVPCVGIAFAVVMFLDLPVKVAGVFPVLRKCVCDSLKTVKKTLCFIFFVLEKQGV